MVDIEKVYEGMFQCEPSKERRKCNRCPYQDKTNCDVVLYNDVLIALREVKDGMRQEKLRLFTENIQLRKDLERERAYNYALVTAIGRSKDS